VNPITKPLGLYEFRLIFIIANAVLIVLAALHTRVVINTGALCGGNWRGLRHAKDYVVVFSSYAAKNNDISPVLEQSPRLCSCPVQHTDVLAWIKAQLTCDLAKHQAHLHRTYGVVGTSTWY
jgi:hypothetical protein